jgi:GT2 family glycosyltransferase
VANPVLTSVVLSVRNGEKQLGRQLRALAAQDPSDNFEMVVVDSGSVDRTADVARAHAHLFMRMVVVRSDRPGLAAARNVGVSAATGSLLLFCDHDDVASPTWANAMSAALGTYDVVGGRLDLTQTNSERVQAWRTEPPPRGLPRTMDYAPYAVGASLGLRRRVHEKLGGFDTAYLGSHDDVEFCWRAQEAGYSIGEAPGAVMSYTLRPRLTSLARQRFGYGRSYAQLHSESLRLGRAVGSGSVGSELQILLRLARTLPAGLVSDGARGRWVYDASWNAGRWAGDVTFRTMCPPSPRPG